MKKMMGFCFFVALFSLIITGITGDVTAGEPAVIVATYNKEPITGSACGTWKNLTFKAYVFDTEGLPCQNIWVYANAEGKGYFEGDRLCLLTDQEGKVLFNFRTGLEDDNAIFSVGVANTHIKYEFNLFWWKIWSQTEQFQSDIRLYCCLYERDPRSGEILRDADGFPYIVIPEGETRTVKVHVDLKIGVLPEEEPIFSDLWEGVRFSNWSGNLLVELNSNMVGNHVFSLTNGRSISISVK